MALQLQNLSKAYQGKAVIDGVSLDALIDSLRALKRSIPQTLPRL